MKKNKLFLSFVFVLFASVSLLSAKDLSLKDVCDGMAAHPVTRGKFVQGKTLVTKNGSRELKSYGNFIFSLDGIYWKTEKPFPSSMIITKSFIKQRSASGQENVIDGSDSQVFSSMAEILTAIFAGDVSILEENFSIDFKDLGNGDWKADFIPENSSLSSVLGGLALEGKWNESETELDTVAIKQNGSAVVKYTFSNHTYSKELTADEKALFSK